MKKINKLIFATVLFFSFSTIVLAQDTEKNPFIGNWKLTIYETAEGDVETDLKFMMKEGKLTGTIGKESTGKANLSKVEVNGESIEFGYYSNKYGAELMYFMEIVEEGKTEGTLLDMFDLKGEKLN